MSGMQCLRKPKHWCWACSLGAQTIVSLPSRPSRPLGSAALWLRAAALPPGPLSPPARMPSRRTSGHSPRSAISRGQLCASRPTVSTTRMSRSRGLPSSAWTKMAMVSCPWRSLTAAALRLASRPRRRRSFSGTLTRMEAAPLSTPSSWALPSARIACLAMRAGRPSVCATRMEVARSQHPKSRGWCAAACRGAPQACWQSQ
mmetsp:Transcript_39177/g.93915  ORF Transcript_39177/g.93915 Transcript_39177/m.93915 type:complete len:202 (-) Transcript_39177:404-1009(-)